MNGRGRQGCGFISSRDVWGGWKDEAQLTNEGPLLFRWDLHHSSACSKDQRYAFCNQDSDFNCRNDRMRKARLAVERSKE